MPLDTAKLDNVRTRGGRIVAACPACREAGADRSGEHLVILDGGKWGCIANTGDAGKEHRRRIAHLAGLDTSKPFTPPIPAKPRPVAHRAPPRLPRDIRRPAGEELAQIARVRGWPTADGLAHLVGRGLLHVGTVDDRGNPALCWIVSDGTTAEARRLDGQPFPGIGAKAYSLSAKDRPIVSVSADCDTVHLAEGLPDLLACAIALTLAGHNLARTGFLCVLGAGCKLGEAAHLLAGKKLVIAEDADRSGLEAADRWTAEAYAAGCEAVESFTYAPGIKDFSDHLAALSNPVSGDPAPLTRPAPERPAALKESPPSPAPTATPRPPLVPLESPWVEGRRYRYAGCYDLRRLPLFVQDSHGDTLRRHGVLMSVPTT